VTRTNAEPQPAAAGAGLFIAFEGGEGCGKSTQVPLLASWLSERGHVVRTTFEPGDGVLGQAIRSIVLDPANTDLSDRAEALLYAADRAAHVDGVLRPALGEGAVVISDRYMDSSLAYQGAGRNLTMADVERVSRWATQGLRPDLVILLDIDPVIGLERAGRRSAADRIEGESLAFHKRVRRSFLHLAGRGGHYLVLDATAPIDQIAALIRQGVGPLLPPAPVPPTHPLGTPAAGVPE